MKKSGLIFLFFCFCLTFVSGIDETLLFSEDELITVATKTPVQFKDAPAAVSVITHAQIEAMGYTTLAEILQSVPGIYVSNGERHLRRLSIRNVTSSYNDKALLLIDGVPYREIFYGHLFIDEYFPVEIIKQIEIIRGPGSAMYGTNAFGGVINIVTKSFEDIDKPGKDEYNEFLNNSEMDSTTAFYAKVGSHDFSEFSILSTMKFEDESEIVLFGRKYDTLGSGPQYDKKHHRKAFPHNPARGKSFMLKWKYKDFRINTFYIEFQHKFPVLSDFPAEIDLYNLFTYRDLGIDLFLNHEFNDRLNVELKFSYQNYDDGSFWQEVESYEEEPGLEDVIVTYDIWPIKKSRLGFGQLQVNYDVFKENKVTLGFEYSYEELVDVRDLYINKATGETSAPGSDPAIGPYNFWADPTVKHNKVFYLQDQQRLGKFNFMLGLRNDIHEVFGTTTSPRGAVIYTPNKYLKIKALYGTAFRAPSYRELYTRVSILSWIKGNDELEPEKITTKEVELVFSPDQNNEYTLNVYNSEIIDLIGRGGEIGVDEIYENLENEVDIKGMEFSHKMRFKKLQSTLNFSYCEAFDVDSKELLEHLPTTMANWRLIYSPNQYLNFTVINTYVGSRLRWRQDTNEYYPGVIVDPQYPIGEKRPDVPEYLRTDVNVLLDINRYKVGLHVFNLFNTSYYDPYYKSPKAFDIKGPERMIHISLTHYF